MDEEVQDFKVGEVIIYKNGYRHEVGLIKSLVRDGAFVWYHEGCTAARTPFDCMHKIANEQCIKETSLGGNTAKEYFRKMEDSL